MDLKAIFDKKRAKSVNLCDAGALFRRFRLDNRENGAKLVMQQQTNLPRNIVLHVTR